MDLKFTVDAILKEKKRPFSWLAAQMGWTFDGLKLSLITGSIKYRDINAMAELLEVPARMFFHEGSATHQDSAEQNSNEPIAEPQNALKQALKSCKELNAALKDQIKDKDQIIALLNKD
ncbi:hypothetical protein [Pedobacter gandavensis]|uniref:hypothetical protein n=1 Tax=Pedobacter gandavensis TaxID=2679963 RepID=UPI0029303005|nr:hypothetical protein [Pedobacter gandavensis]